MKFKYWIESIWVSFTPTPSTTPHICHESGEQMSATKNSVICIDFKLKANYFLNLTRKIFVRKLYTSILGMKFDKHTVWPPLPLVTVKLTLQFFGSLQWRFTNLVQIGLPTPSLHGTSIKRQFKLSISNYSLTHKATSMCWLQRRGHWEHEIVEWQVFGELKPSQVRIVCPTLHLHTKHPLLSGKDPMRMCGHSCGVWHLSNKLSTKPFGHFVVFRPRSALRRLGLAGT